MTTTKLQKVRDEARSAFRAWHETVEQLRANNERGLTELTQEENELIERLQQRMNEANTRLYEMELARL